MERIINHRDFNVFKLEKSFWDIAYHNHNFYEIIVIEEGHGEHRLNDVTFLYQKGNVFFLKPSDAHEFVIAQKTQFIYLKFTDKYINELFLWNPGLKGRFNFDDLLLKTSNHYASFVNNPDDAKHFKALAEILVDEFTQAKHHSFELSFQLFYSLMLLLSRNISTDTTHLSILKTSKIEQIISYINLHALDKGRMKIAHLAGHFAMSENYISTFVKKHVGMSVQQYIIQIKLKSAEKLLAKSNFNINEISERLGFTDASHFNKFFKKYRKINPSDFYKKNKID